MSNVISFLERLGQDATLRHASKGDVALALTRAQIDPDLSAAILAGKQSEIEMLLGADTNVCCGLAPEKREDEEEQPSKDDDEAKMLQNFRGIASAA